MKVLVSDSSVLIDLLRYDLMSPLSDLPYEFVIPDITLKELFVDDQREQVLGVGIAVESLTAEEMLLLMNHRTACAGLSAPDCASMALVQSRGWELLAGDGVMRRTAVKYGYVVHGTLWLFDEFFHHGIVEGAHLSDVLKRMLDDLRIRLPRREMTRRIVIYGEGKGLP